MKKFAVVVAVIVLVILSTWFSQALFGNPEKQAREFAVKMGMELRGVDCQRYDSDGNGYVSCTLSTMMNDKIELYPIECAVVMSWNSGCRRARLTP